MINTACHPYHQGEWQMAALCSPVSLFREERIPLASMIHRWCLSSNSDTQHLNPGLPHRRCLSVASVQTSHHGQKQREMGLSQIFAPGLLDLVVVVYLAFFSVIDQHSGHTRQTASQFQSRSAFSQTAFAF